MISAAIFDLDGTLVDSNELHVQAWQETFRHFGKEFPVERLREQVGKGGDQFCPFFSTKKKCARSESRWMNFAARSLRKNTLTGPSIPAGPGIIGASA
jgi:beta-phosphoglucomutase-like phosphatase (HAD superfamily)